MSKRVRITKVKRAPFLLQQIDAVRHAVTTTQDLTNMFTFTEAGTVKGLRWSISIEPLASGLGAWAIVIVRDGNTANTMAITDGVEFYTPEVDVMAAGTFSSTTGVHTLPIEGKTKGMRRVNAGDNLQFISLGDVATLCNLLAVVRFWQEIG